MKVLLIFIVGVFVIAAFPRFDFVRRKPVWLLAASIVVAASFTSLRIIGV